MEAGTLTLAVWPDAPVGEHQRYAYRITDATIGQAVEGRDLFTGAGSPVEPDRALRDLATFLSTAGDARQRAPDHPGSNRGNAGLFPVWVPEAAHTSADAPAEVTAETKLPRHQAGQVSIFSSYVEVRGLEPLTFSMPWRRATSCAIPP